MTALTALEEIIDASGAAPRIEVMVPTGVRPRHLRVRTLVSSRGGDVSSSGLRAELDHPLRGTPTGPGRDVIITTGQEE